MSEPLRWGILGTGMIADRFAEQLQQTDMGELAAVGSRSPEAAEQFAARRGGRAVSSYHAVLGESDVDAVYIALPNDLHEPWSLEALRARKHVLCEKPLTFSQEAARRVFAAAEDADRVLIEAFMYRLHPGIARLTQLIRNGAIGKLKLIRTQFTFNRPVSTQDARYQFDKGGGALLDIGCYCVNLARTLVDAEPTDAAVFAHPHHHGVDDYAVGILHFGHEVLANFGCGMTVHNDRSTRVYGDAGAIHIDDTWLDPCRLTLWRDGADEPEIIEAPAPLPPFALEAATFARVVRGEARPWVTPADSIAQAALIESLRGQITTANATVGGA